MPGRLSWRISARLLALLLKHCTCWRAAALHGSSSPSVSFHSGASWRQACLSLRAGDCAAPFRSIDATAVGADAADAAGGLAAAKGAVATADPAGAARGTG